MRIALAWMVASSASYVGGMSSSAASCDSAVRSPASGTLVLRAIAGSSSTSDGGSSRSATTSRVKASRSASDGKRPSNSRYHTSSNVRVAASSGAEYWR